MRRRFTDEDWMVDIGPVQTDGSILVAATDPTDWGGETHDLIVDGEGVILSENIWGGKDDENRCDCDGFRYGLLSRESRYVDVCDNCGRRVFDTHHCLILDPELHRIYERNDGASFFHWELIDLEAWDHQPRKLTEVLCSICGDRYPCTCTPCSCPGPECEPNCCVGECDLCAYHGGGFCT